MTDLVFVAGLACTGAGIVGGILGYAWGYADGKLRAAENALLEPYAPAEATLRLKALATPETAALFKRYNQLLIDLDTQYRVHTFICCPCGGIFWPSRDSDRHCPSCGVLSE